MEKALLIILYCAVCLLIVGAAVNLLCFLYIQGYKIYSMFQCSKFAPLKNSKHEIIVKGQFFSEIETLFLSSVNCLNRRTRNDFLSQYSILRSKIEQELKNQ